MCAVLGLALGLLIANLQFSDLHVLRGAAMLYGVLGLIVGYFTGGWFFLDRAGMRTAKS
jgi:hypothetical protein